MPFPGFRRWFAALPLLLAATLVPARAEEGELMRRMNREADRVGRREAGPPAPFAGDDFNLSDQRSRQAERIMTRAVRGLVCDRIEDLARSSTGLSQFLRRLSISSFAGPAPIEESAAPLSPGADPRAVRGPDRGRDPATASMALRLDAHPRLVVRGRIGTLSGTVEMPLLDRDLRLSVEQTFGHSGRAVLRGGRSEDRGDWATVGFSLQF
jgi:hypothetical protein